MKKFLFLFLGFVCGLFLLQFSQVSASTDTALCSPVALNAYFSDELKKEQALFVTNNSEAQLQKFQNLVSSVIEKYQNKNISLELHEKLYHEEQSQLFKNAILYMFRNFDDKNTSTFTEGFTAYPFTTSYLDSTKDLKTQNNIPSFVLGLDASLHFAAFSCNHKFDADKIVQDTSALADFSEYFKTEKAKVENDIFYAEQTLRSALQAYDALAVAYPQHIAYENLKTELRTLRTDFKSLEKITSKCVYPNHFNQSCKK